MRFDPKTEDQLLEENLVPRGQYEAEVLSAENAVSKSNNEMIKLKLRVYMPDGGTRTVWDYLLEAMPFKLRHFCVAAGIEDKYNAGALDASDCQGAYVQADIDIRPAKGEYGPSNAVMDYQPIPRKTRGGAQAPARKPATVNNGATVIQEDEIPF
jgi:hypothetical protein